MRKWALILGLAGALWMVFVLYSKIVAPSEGEQLSGSLCGKVGAVQGHRPVCWDRSGFQYLAGADKCSGMDCGGPCRPFDYSLAVTIRPMSKIAIYRQLRENPWTAP